MSYRPITDIWFLARAKLKEGRKYYGAYLGGFPERARALLGCKLDEPVLHVCGGMAKFYPYKRAFGPNDMTLDLDPKCEPDICQDARLPLPWAPRWGKYQLTPPEGEKVPPAPWAGILIDPPYSEGDAAHYAVGADAYPKPNQLIKNAFDVLPPGGRVGMIHYILPSPPKDAIFVAAVGVLCGFNNRIRIYSVFEKPSL
jgi:hypothetical protein